MSSADSASVPVWVSRSSGVAVVVSSVSGASVSSGDPVSFDGNHYSLEEASIGFSPSGPPRIYVASAAFDPAEGFPESIERRIVTHGDGWLPVGLSPASYAAGWDRLRGLLEAADRTVESFDRACYVDVVVADTEAAAIEEARSFLQRYYSEAFLEQFHDGLPDDVIRKRGAFGPPATVAAALKAYEDAGVERFVVRFLARDQIGQQRRFARAIQL